ncbi:MAG: integrase [Pirellulaceae bacterium]|nr:integrase [Pirellulaceae bacterium]
MKRKSSRSKPARKSRSEFPLSRHSRGVWCKNIKTPDGWKMFYFGRIEGDEDGCKALELFNHEAPYHREGRIPPPLPRLVEESDVLTVKKLVNKFLNFKHQLVESGELAQRSLDEYILTSELLAEHLGSSRPVSDLTSGDFQSFRAVLAKRYGPVRLGNTIQRVRSIFKFGYDSDMMDKPVKFGPGFRKPSAKTLRATRLEKGPKMFQPEELRAILEHATPNIKAMVLLGINGGLGNTDCAELELRRLDLTSGWLVYPRGKTAINRRISLWPETIEAIKEAIKHRGTPQDPQDKGLLFIGRRGQNYVVGRKGYRIHQEFQRVCKAAGVAGRTFYDLRRTFETVGGASRDQAAVDAVMGHAPPENDMAALYRQTVGDDRLQAVVNHVRQWLFPRAAESDTEEPATLRFPSAG